MLPIYRLPLRQGVQHAQGGQCLVVAERDADRRAGELVACATAAYAELFLPHNLQPTPHRALISLYTGFGESLAELMRRRRSIGKAFQQHKDAANCLETLTHNPPLSQTLVTICNKSVVASSASSAARRILAAKVREYGCRKPPGSPGRNHACDTWSPKTARTSIL
jgi:hypothetical protein